MHAEIVSIGTEILMGEIVDTNSAMLAAELPKVGVDLRWVTKVGDDPERLFDTIDRARRRSDLTLTTGGLGPTSDDLTRETIARVMGEEMSVRADLLRQLKAYFAGRGMPMPETNVKQATVIPSAEVLPNPMGTAPGWWVERDGRIVVAMPGPPRELDRMWSREVAPRLRDRNPGVAIATRTWKTYGISEGGLNEMVAQLFESLNPSLGIYSKADGIHLRAIATAATEEEAVALIGPVETAIREAVGDSIWGEGDDTPEAQAGAQLRRRGQTLGIAESFTGGLVTSTLSSVPESHDFLIGGVLATDGGVLDRYGALRETVRTHGPVSAAAAEEMADAARDLFGSNAGVGVTDMAMDGGPVSTPPGTVYIGYVVDGRRSSVSGRYPPGRLRMRSRAATHALLGLIELLGE